MSFSENLGNAGLFISSIFIILSIYSLNYPKTAQKGILFSSFGIFVAILMTLIKQDLKAVNYIFLPIFMVLGAYLGQYLSNTNRLKYNNWLANFLGKIQFIFAITQVIVTLNLVSIYQSTDISINPIEVYLCILLASLQLGSTLMIIFQEKLADKPKKGSRMIFILIVVLNFLLFFIYCISSHISLVLLQIPVNGILGFLLTQHIPYRFISVIITMLQAIGGISIVLLGFISSSQILILTGAIIASSGIIMADQTSKNMQNTIFNIIFRQGRQDNTMNDQDKIQSCTSEENELNLDEIIKAILDAKSVIIVPGQQLTNQSAQEIAFQIYQFLIKKGVPCNFCLHPLSSQVLGQMCIDLNQVGVSRKHIFHNEKINNKFSKTDLVLVFEGENLCNPKLLEKKLSVCEVWKAKEVILFKRGHKLEERNPLLELFKVKYCFGELKLKLKDILEKLMQWQQTQNEDQVEQLESIMDIERFKKKTTLQLGVLKEVEEGEDRVAITPKIAGKLFKLGFQILVEESAGIAAGFPDEEYEKKGALIVKSEQIYKQAEILVKVKCFSYNTMLGKSELDLIKENQNIKFVISQFLGKHQSDNVQFLSSGSKGQSILFELEEEEEDEENKQNFQEQRNSGEFNDNYSIFGLDLLKGNKISKSFDVNDIMGNIKGQKIVLDVMSRVKNLSDMEVLVIGTSFTCLSVIKHFKQYHNYKSIKIILYGVKSEKNTHIFYQFYKEGIQILQLPSEIQAHVQTNRFYDPQLLYQFISQQCQKANIVISDAHYLGRAPIIITQDVVNSMPPHSIIVDAAIDYGGNCEYTNPGNINRIGTQLIIGTNNYLSQIASQSSVQYSQIIYSFFEYLLELKDNQYNKANNLSIDFQDEIIQQICIYKQGQYQIEVPEFKSLNNDQVDSYEVIYVPEISMQQEFNQIKQDMVKQDEGILIDESQYQKSEERETEYNEEGDDLEFEDNITKKMFFPKFQILDSISTRYPIIDRIRKNKYAMLVLCFVLVIIFAIIIAILEDSDFVPHLFIFVLSLFVGKIITSKSEPILYSVFLIVISVLNGIIITQSIQSGSVFSFAGFFSLLGSFTTLFFISFGYQMARYILNKLNN